MLIICTCTRTSTHTRYNEYLFDYSVESQNVKYV